MIDTRGKAQADYELFYDITVDGYRVAQHGEEYSRARLLTDEEWAIVGPILKRPLRPEPANGA